MTGPATTYAAITREVERIIAESGENDRARAGYMVARAALLTLAAHRGQAKAAETAFILGDELAGILPP